MKKSRFGDWSEDETDVTTNPLGNEVEIDLYLKIGRPVSDDRSKLLLWWQSKSTTFKRLSKLARRVLAKPATGATSERTWSRAGLILTEKRTNLSPKKVCDQLVIHNYLMVSMWTYPPWTRKHSQSLFEQREMRRKGGGRDFSILYQICQLTGEYRSCTYNKAKAHWRLHLNFKLTLFNVGNIASNTTSTQPSIHLHSFITLARKVQVLNFRVHPEIKSAIFLLC